MPGVVDERVERGLGDAEGQPAAAPRRSGSAWSVPAVGSDVPTRSTVPSRFTSWLRVARRPSVSQIGTNEIDGSRSTPKKAGSPIHEGVDQEVVGDLTTGHEALGPGQAEPAGHRLGHLERHQEQVARVGSLSALANRLPGAELGEEERRRVRLAHHDQPRCGADVHQPDARGRGQALAIVASTLPNVTVDIPAPPNDAGTTARSRPAECSASRLATGISADSS